MWGSRLTRRGVACGAWWGTPQGGRSKKDERKAAREAEAAVRVGGLWRSLAGLVPCVRLRSCPMAFDAPGSSLVATVRILTGMCSQARATAAAAVSKDVCVCRRRRACHA